MHQLDVFADIPEHLVGVYDIIQLRLFQVVVKDNDPLPLLKNVLKMLSAFLPIISAFRFSHEERFNPCPAKSVILYSDIPISKKNQEATSSGANTT